ncbi:MAG: hypothetical protein AAGH92_08840 [Planctomycetota bacterium]
MTPPFAQQSNRVRFWAMFSSMSLAVVLLIGGAFLLFAQQHTQDFRTELPRLFHLVSSAGLLTVLIAWFVHLVALIALLGYEENSAREAGSIVVFCVCVGYGLLVIMGSILPFVSGMKSMM